MNLLIYHRTNIYLYRSWKHKSRLIFYFGVYLISYSNSVSVSCLCPPTSKSFIWRMYIYITHTHRWKFKFGRKYQGMKCRLGWIHTLSLSFMFISWQPPFLLLFLIFWIPNLLIQCPYLFQTGYFIIVPITTPGLGIFRFWKFGRRRIGDQGWIIHKMLLDSKLLPGHEVRRVYS